MTELPVEQPAAEVHGDLAERVAGLQLEARRLASGVLQGLHRSVHRGGSTEFAEYVEYTPGDDPRTIDWKSVAKTDRYFVKRFEETTNRPAFLLLDASASMGVSRAGRPTPLELARVVLGALASLLLGQGDAVGASVLREGEELERLPSRARGGHLDAVLGCLAGAAPKGRTDLGAALDAAALGIPRRALVLLASDLVDDVDEVGSALRRLAARGHEILVLHVLDVDALEFPFMGTLRFRDPETGQEVIADASVVAEGYRRELDKFLAACESECAAARADLVRLSTGEDPTPVLLTFLAQRHALARRLATATR